EQESEKKKFHQLHYPIYFYQLGNRFWAGNKIRPQKFKVKTWLVSASATCLLSCRKGNTPSTSSLESHRSQISCAAKIGNFSSLKNLLIFFLPIMPIG